jgi:hypothetical protein
MLLYGTDEVFAYHIVYKVPHNFQVILKVDFDEEVKQLYLRARSEYPNDVFIFLIDTMDIRQIGAAESISGTLIREDATKVREIVKEQVVLSKESFKILYFDELPLSLDSNRSDSQSISRDMTFSGRRTGGPHKCDNWVCTPFACACHD